MYDNDPSSCQRTEALPRIATGTLMMDAEPPEHALVSPHRLRAVVTELSAALEQTLRDERTSAAATLQRAQVMLHTAEGTSAQPSEAGVRGGLAPWQVRRVLAHIEANLETPIRNQDLASIARLSADHFNVAFRSSVGEAPHGYIIRRRVERAQGLMLSTVKPLSEIALECGLTDQAHFTRLFRRIVGESPAAWRRARINPR
jgi:transcriptional regulator GlxA family with amidase domain